MDLNEVASFVRVVECGSFSRAAKQLGIPRSTVSRRVARLEETLGVRLLKRTTRRMSLTEEGSAYFERVSPAVHTVQDAADLARDLGSEPRGTLRITAPADFGQDYLPELCVEFLERYPEVQMHVELTTRVVDLIEEGFDLAIRGGKLPDSSLVVRTIDRMEAWLFASPAYLERRGVPQTPADLADHACILFQTTATSQRWRLLHEGGAEAQVMVSGPLETNDFALTQEVVASGLGIGLMPAFLGRPQCRYGQLVRILPGWSSPGGGLHIVMPSGRYLAAKTRAFRDLLLERLTPPPWRPTPMIAP